MRRLPILFILYCVTVTGCASRPDRTEIFVDTAPPGAACTLTRAGVPVASVSPTPAIAWVPPGADDITIECRRNGYQEASAVVHSHSSMPAMGELFGGGSVVHYDYDSPVQLTLVPQ